MKVDRLLIVPAAGRGSRLGADRPKALVEVNGVTMLDHVLCLHRPTVDRAVVVVSPEAFPPFEEHLRLYDWVSIAIQAKPLGMIDAMLAPYVYAAHYRPRRIVVTWCDQIAVRPDTLDQLNRRAMRADAPHAIVPAVVCANPYTHLVLYRNDIVEVMHASEGDVMPKVGLSDMGVFDFSYPAYAYYLSGYAVSGGSETSRQRDLLLPFLPWLAKRFPVALMVRPDPMEARGINTPEDLKAVSEYLAQQPV